MLKDQHNTEVRVLPAGNDVARLAPLRAGRAQVAATGTGLYFAQEGVFEFAARDWGPQALQTVLSTLDCNGLVLGVAKDTGVKEVKDLKGKRVGFVVGSPALNQNALGIIAYGGLTKADVKIVEFSSYGAMWKGILNNEVDAAFGSTITGPAKEVETSPRGLVWPPLPHADKAAWERVKKVGAYFVPHVATCGAAGITAQASLELASYPYPLFAAYTSSSPEMIYALAKAMIAGYDAFKDGAPGASGLKADKQNRQWVVPVHASAAKALKEAGQWSDADETHNVALRKRQEVLKGAWDAYLKTNPADDKEKFRDGWMAARKDALAKANMPNGFEE
jgi:TRAP transporter TAXI family solute receptor